MRTVLASIAAAALIAAAAAPSVPSAPSVPPCLEEDGSGQTSCYWDARTRGNRLGASYVLIGGERV